MLTIKMLAVLALMSIVAPSLAQEIYKWKDAKGQWHFSDQPPDPSEGREVRGPSAEEQLRNALKAKIENLESKTAGKIIIDDAVIRLSETGRYLYVEGKLRNGGRNLSESIKVYARATDQGGRLLEAEWMPAERTYLLPDQTAQFRITLHNTSERYGGIYDVELVPDWRGRLTEEKMLVRNPYFRY